jgi:hypothetical protein
MVFGGAVQACEVAGGGWWKNNQAQLVGLMLSAALKSHAFSCSGHPVTALDHNELSPPYPPVYPV